MDFDSWRSLRFLVRRHFRELLISGFVTAEPGEAGWLGGSGYVILHRDKTWIRIVRHMGQEFVELAFIGPPEESDWFDLVEVLMAIDVHFDIVPGLPAIPHRLEDKSAALIAHLEEIERALRENEVLFLSRIRAARNRDIRRRAEAFVARQSGQSTSRDISPSLQRYRALVHELKNLLVTYADSPWTTEVKLWAEDVDYVITPGRRSILDKIVRSNKANLFGMGRLSDLVLVPGTDPRLPQDASIVQAINQRITALCKEIADAGDAVLEELREDSASSH